MSEDIREIFRRKGGTLTIGSTTMCSGRKGEAHVIKVNRTNTSISDLTPKTGTRTIGGATFASGKRGLAL